MSSPRMRSCATVGRAAVALALAALTPVALPAAEATRQRDLATAPAASAGALPPAERLRVTGLALGGRGYVDLELERFELLAPDLRYARDGVPVPAPRFLGRIALYRGAVAGEPGSRAFALRAGDGRLAGTVVHDGLAYELVTEGGALLAHAESGETESLAGCRVERPAPARSAATAAAKGSRAAGARRPPPVPIPAGRYRAPVLVEARHDLWRRFLGDEQRVVEELLRYFGLVSDSLQRAIDLELQVAGIGLQTQPEPRWTWPEFLRTHPVESSPRAFVYMVNDAAAAVDGGGWLAGLCTAYGPGDYSTGPPRDFGWSWLSAHTIAHEIGHVLGSDHTHCYGYSDIRYGDGLDARLVRGAPGEPPVDKCWGRDETCYVGPAETLPFGEGSTMSYCPARSGSYGEPGRHGVRSERVPAMMRATVERAAARYPACLERLTDAVGLRVAARGAGTAALAWNDVFDGETGWALERRAGRAWRTARVLPANATGVTLERSHAKPGAAYRLRARFRGNVSEPSVPVTLP